MTVPDGFKKPDEIYKPNSVSEKRNDSHLSKLPVAGQLKQPTPEYIPYNGKRKGLYASA